MKKVLVGFQYYSAVQHNLTPEQTPCKPRVKFRNLHGVYYGSLPVQIVRQLWVYFGFICGLL